MEVTALLAFVTLCDTELIGNLPADLIYFQRFKSATVIGYYLYEELVLASYRAFSALSLMLKSSNCNSAK